MKKYQLLFSLIFPWIFVFNIGWAELKTFEREYTYEAGEADSKLTSRAIALEQVKRLLLEELGTYLESFTEVKNFQLTKDQIIVLSGGVAQTKILEEKWDGKVYWLKAQIVADPSTVIKDLAKLREDHQRVRELEETKKKADDALVEIEKLKQELAKSQTETSKQDIQKAYLDNTKYLTAKDWWETSLVLGDRGDYAEAITATNKAIELTPNGVIEGRRIKGVTTSVNLYFTRGVLYNILGDYAQSIRDFDKALEKQPGIIDAYTMRGDSYHRLGKYQEALNDFNWAIKTYQKIPYPVRKNLNGDYSIALMGRSITYAALHNYEHSIEDLNNAIKIDGNFAEAYLRRGLIYSILKNYGFALNDYNKSIELNPNDTTAYCWRADLYSVTGDNLLAIKDCNRAIELNPKCALAYTARGYAFSLRDDLNQAIIDWKFAARLGNTQAQEYLRVSGETW